MSEEVRQTELMGKMQRLLRGNLKHIRVVTLAASLVPLGAVMLHPLGADACPYGQTCTDVPEPSSLALLGSGIAGLALTAATGSLRSRKKAVTK